MSKTNWQLSTVEELSAMIVEMGKDTNKLRQQKHYYKRTENVVMLGRIDEAVRLAKSWENM